ncbi:MAG: hypothetical protein ACI8ZM_002762 [Crocinitomix sp.]|jgi:hypothetical protein
MSDITLNAVSGIDINQSEITSPVEFTYGDFNEGSQGKPITKEFAQELVNRNNWKNTDASKIAAVTFNARPLLLLLSQKDCVGIRYYYAKNKNETETIVLVGVDTDGNDLGATHNLNDNLAQFASIITDITPGKSSLIIEVGGGNSIANLGL